jgi:hypothetical protein
MAAAVDVAIGFVSEAMSKRVAGVTARSESPPFFREEREKNGGVPMGIVPKDFRATVQSLWVTATEAAGKACCLIASRRIVKAWRKTSSWVSNDAISGGAGVRVDSLGKNREPVRVIAEWVNGVKALESAKNLNHRGHWGYTGKTHLLYYLRLLSEWGELCRVRISPHV